MKFKTKPYAHQLKVWDESKDQSSWALLLDCGTGKTWVAINTAAYLADKREVQALLVIAPNGVNRQWVDSEIPLHWPDSVPYTAVVWDSSKDSKNYKKDLDSLFKDDGGVKVLSMNVEAMSTKKGPEFADKFLSRWRDNMVVVDESSRIKSPTAKRTKNIVKLRQKAKYRRILTGTPITQSPLDVYPQFFFLNPDILGFTSFVAFRSNYAIMVKGKAMDGNGRRYSYDSVVGYKRLEDLSNRIAPYSSRVLKGDCLDLPDKIYQVIPVACSSEQERLYTKLRQDLLLEVGGENVPVPLVLTQLLRLQQITGGFLGTEDGTTEPIQGSNPKLSAMLDDIADLPVADKVIIWARFRAEIEMISEAIWKRYGYESCGMYYGGVDNQARSDTVDQFTNGSMRFLVANAQCAGLGLNLTAANIVYYYSNDFSLENRLQSQDRNFRIGQKKVVVYKDLICSGTIDEKVHKAIQRKKSIADIVTGDGVGAVV